MFIYEKRSRKCDKLTADEKTNEQCVIMKNAFELSAYMHFKQYIVYRSKVPTFDSDESNYLIYKIYRSTLP